MIQTALGWTILHSLWEGTLAALLLALALGMTRSSRARYAAACLALLAILAGFAITLWHIMNAGRPGGAILSTTLPPIPLNALQNAPGGPGRWGLGLVLPWLTPFWIAGVAAFYVHSLVSWFSARQMLRRGICNPPDLWQDRFTTLRERLLVSAPVVLLESCLADVPVVIGYLRPVILVPVGMLTGMPAAQMESILLHELAHVGRRDYLVNLLQILVEGFLFYHPAVWWISRVIRTEREHCCDDLVVAVSGDAHEYASALAGLEESRWSASYAATAANGGNLMKRIRRLLYPREASHASIKPALSAAILTLTAAVALTAWQNKPNPDAHRTPLQAWVEEDVVYIISEPERKAFTELQTDEERYEFVKQFWLRRDPTPGTERNEYQEEHYRRIDYANRHFETLNHTSGWKTDRGKIYIIYGPADEIESHPNGGRYGQVHTYPFEQWLYRFIQNVGQNVIIEFVDPERKLEYRMTTDPNAKVSR